MSAARRFLQFETFTGWHMLAVMVLFFGTIISVNVTMAYYATSSWSGLLVKNTYVASQNFDDDVALDREMSERGWISELQIGEDAIIYHLSDAEGQPILADSVAVTISRPVGILQDQVVQLVERGDGVYTASLTIDPGQWIARINAEKDGALLFREVHRIELPMKSTGR